MKVHAITNTSQSAFCGRKNPSMMNTDMRRVTCEGCKDTDKFEAYERNQKMDREAAIDASPALRVMNPWDQKKIVCRACGNDTFKDAGRSLHKFNHKCAACGTMNHTLTETGMCS